MDPQDHVPGAYAERWRLQEISMSANVFSAVSLPESLSVSELVTELGELLEENYPAVWVHGEVSNFTAYKGSGHWYFTLKDDMAQIRAVMFRGNNLRCRFTPRDGMAVVACGRVSVYPSRGEMQLQVLRLEPAGLGTSEQRRRELLELLRSRGYFEPSRKRPLPPYPRRVALVTSAFGAAVRDMLELFAQRWPLTELVLRHSAVQGEGAAEELAQALIELNQLHRSGRLPLDVIIVARGGGSSEDLSAFDTLAVADAIYHSEVPVVSAVGHEIDVTIADLVADKRAETPSAAVMLVVPHRSEMQQKLHGLGQRLHQAVTQSLHSCRRKLERLQQHAGWRQPERRVHTLQQRLDEWASRLPIAMTRYLQLAQRHCDSQATRLQALSPWQVLQRGYSLTVTAEGQIIRQAQQVRPGQILRTYLAEGSLTTAALEVHSDPTPHPFPRGDGSPLPAEPSPPHTSSIEAQPPISDPRTQEEL
jgi:exodeoxyribonuclease VII large subunit